jgi:hypothetical protein
MRGAGMSGNDYPITLWNSSDQVAIPQETSAVGDIVEYAAPTLSKRDMKAIISGFQSESFEMVSTYVWAKASSALKKQVAVLGMEFVGEMLGRPDLDDDADPSTTLADHEAIALAEDLGMITTTQAIRLKHALELVRHFANLSQEDGSDDCMNREEALNLLRTCVTSILGKPHFEAAIRFVEFRRALSSRLLSAEDGDVRSIMSSPYFFLRTTVSVLLSMVKTLKGASLEHAVGNTTLLVPLLWERFRDAEKWQVGQAYAEVVANGNRQAAAGLKKALVSTHGFDFVPETLRSNAFTEAAARVLKVHFEFNNFYTEADPMRLLSNLGTAIPRPAFGKCMEAILAVWLGNAYGSSHTARPIAEQMLRSLRREQWEYYVGQCLYRDRTVLDKLSGEEKPVSRWCELVGMFELASIDCQDQKIRKMLQASFNANSVSKSQVMVHANALRAKCVR